jgi:DNA-binding transcriptional MerR regulator
MASPSYSLEELAEMTAVPVRTLRYYIALGILPSPARRGRGARYPESALRRLQLVKEMRSHHLPLAEIRERLAAIPDEALPPAGRVVAEDRLVYEDSGADRDGPGEDREWHADALEWRRPRPVDVHALDLLADRPMLPRAATPLLPGPSPFGPERPATRLGSRSQWERIAIEPGVELHVQRPLTRRAAKRVERLLDAAREIVERDEPKG